ncbi:DUF4423 domain-containing protein [Bdellovibrionota bacterium FG-1]
MDLFLCDDYKKILRNRVEKLKTQNKRMTFQNLATFCRIQKTYLSRVFSHDKNHLSPDQFYLALEFLGFSNEERNYLHLVFERQRTDLAQRRENLALQIETIRKVRLRTESHLTISPTAVQQQDWTDYYLDPNCQLVHLFLTVPKYAEQAELIRKKLELPKRRFDEILKRLLRMGVISVEPEGYKVVREQMHLPSESPLLGPYRTLLRIKGLERMQKLSSDEAYTFSVVFSASPKEKKWIQTEFLALLKRIEKTVAKAPATEVYQMSFDLFDWSGG